MIYKLNRYILAAGGFYGLSNVKRIDQEYVSTVAKIENIQKYTEHRSKRARSHYDVTVTYMLNRDLDSETAMVPKINMFSEWHS